jgi:beta-N-acetylhexosaminidase
MSRSKEIEDLAASVLLIGFAGLEPAPEVRALIGRGVAGVILFRRNVVAPPQIFELCRSLKSLTEGHPLLCAVDQEGGRVARLRQGFTQFPAMRTLGQTGDADLAEEVGLAIGRECRAVGFDLDFAPVLDVDTNPDNPVIGDRSFGTSPELCATMGAAIIRGLQASGVAACGKHLPGHGDTHQDSHLTLPRLTHGFERLDEVELLPFRRAIATGVASLMTAHVVFPSLDPSYPVTLSEPALAALRLRLGLTEETSPLIIADDLEMSAVSESWDIATAAPLAIAAGCDVLLVCHRIDRQEVAFEALCRHAESSAGRGQLERARRRVRRFAERWYRAADRFLPELLRQPEALGLVERIAACGPHPTDPTEA